MRRVVVTGLGIVSSIGNNAQEVLASLKASRSGISANEQMKEHGFRSQIAGAIDLDPAAHIDKRTLRFMGPGAAYAYIAMGQAIADGTQLIAAARPVLQALRDAVGQTVTISIPESTGMRVLDIVRVETPVQIVTRPGAILSVHRSAQGKIALAFGPMDTSGLPDTDQPRDRARFDAEVARARETGWAVAPEEALPGVNALSAPIFDIDNRLVATITVVGPVTDLEPEPAPHFIAALSRAAREISAEIGCMEYPL